MKFTINKNKTNNKTSKIAATSKISEASKISDEAAFKQLVHEITNTPKTSNKAPNKATATATATATTKATNEKSKEVLPEVAEIASSPIMEQELLQAYREMGGVEYLKKMAILKPDLFMKLILTTLSKEASIEINEKKEKSAANDKSTNNPNTDRPAILRILA